MEQNTEDKTPPLLRLPAELLDAIFELTYEDEKPTEPLCRALLPFHRTALYRNVEVDSVRRLNLFRHVVRDTQRVRPLVKSLEVNLTASRWSKSTPEPYKLVNLLGRLSQLQRLALGGLDTASLDAVLADYPSLQPSKLRHVEMRAPTYTDLPHSILTKRLASLNAIPSLKTLTLHIDGFPYPFFSSYPTSMRRVDTLALISSDLDHAPTFVIRELFPNVRRLSLSAQVTSFECQDFILSAPDALEALVLRTSPLFDDEQDLDLFLDDVLPRFAQLEQLELCEGVFDHETFLPVVQSLPRLVHLTFGRDAPVSDALLFSLVDHATKPSPLQRLTLNHVEAQRGPSIEDYDWVLSPEADNTDGHTYPGWRAPKWNLDSSENGLRTVKARAALSGVKVDGTAVDALGWEHEHEAEVLRCTTVWSSQGGGDFEEPNDSYGEGDVLERFEKRLPDWWEAFGEKDEDDEDEDEGEEDEDEGEEDEE
ncbi:hypothetical protein JCM6882_001391 [Rhodosporidiobolus microsporus]